MTFRELTAEQQRQKRAEEGRRRSAEIEKRWQRTMEEVRVSRGRVKPKIGPAIKQRVVTAITQLPQSKQVQFVKREATRVHEEIKKQTRKIPTLRDISLAGYKYGKAHPNSARLIYNSLDAGAKIVREVVPKEAGIPVAQAMYAFSDGAIKGIRNEPVKTLAFFALPGVAGVAIKVARYIPIAAKIVKSEKAMRAAAAGFNIAYTHNVYTRVNAPVLDYYKDGKVLSETSKKLPDGSIQITQNIEQVPVMRKPTTSEKSERLGYVFSTEAGPMVFGAMGMSKVSGTRFKELGKKGVTTTKTTTKKLKKGTKEFIKHEKAQVLIIKPKAKVKAKPKAKPKPKIKPKVKTVNLMKDPKSMAQLNRAKTSMRNVNLIASQKQKYRVQLKAKQVAQLKQKQKTITQKQALINNNIATRQKEIQKMVESIESKLAQGKEVKLLQKQLLKLKNEALDKQRLEIEALLKKIDEYFIAEAKAASKAASIALTKAKVKAKQAQTAKQKATQLNKVKEITKSLSKQRTILIAYSRKVIDSKQRQQITIIVNSIDENIKPPPKPVPKPIIKPKPKPIPPPKKRVIEYPPKPRIIPPPKPPKPKPKPIPPRVIRIPTPKPIIKLKPKKPPTKKKKKKVKKAVKEAFIKNPVPSLKAFLG